MRILMPLVKGNSDIHHMWNPFVYTLTDYIYSLNCNVEFSFNAELFTTNEIFSFDIIHIMWPSIFSFMGNSTNFRHRLTEIKKHGGRIITTCHNLVPHYCDDDDIKAFYNIAFGESDLIIHLGQYSKVMFEEMYPTIKHVIIPHHVYDTLYTDLEKSKNSKRKYISCIGTFRNQEEKDLLKCAGKSLLFSRYYFLVPSLLVVQWNRRNKLALLWTILKRCWLKTRCHIITLNKEWINHEELQRCMKCSDITFIQRKENLNSGNLTLGFLYGNVVVGPNTGNIGRILHDTGNPIFDPDKSNSIVKAIRKSIQMQKEGKGKENQTYALCHWTTRYAAESHYSVYKSLMNNTSISQSSI